MTIDQWLDSGNLQRVAELFAVNGDRLEVVGQIGQSRPCDPEVNRYGRIGIAINEAFELTYYRGIIDALVNSSPNPPATAKAVMERITREARGEMIEIFTVEQLKLWR